jgi:S-DNA-T family DNA segregation ATPase FtsK/SpoIIIE
LFDDLDEKRRMPPAAPKPHEPMPTDTSPLDGASWADKLLRAVAAKLIEFGQKVEPLGVEIGPTFARLRLKPLGRTSIGRVRNHANDLRAHIASISSVPVIADQPGYISVDVQRPDRQTVALAECLRKPPAKLDGQPAFPVGVDVTGKPHWLNLADSSTCHVLAAGTTGSGKSEFLKAMLAGLAARLSPQELGFILVDPKHVTSIFLTAAATCSNRSPTPWTRRCRSSRTASRKPSDAMRSSKSAAWSTSAN